MATQQGPSWPVVLTENGAVDIVEAVTWNQPVPAGGASKALEVVHIALSPHHHLTGRDGLPTGTACTAVSKQPDVVVAAEDHAPLAVAGGADLAQLGLAAGALEAACVPVALHGEKQEAVGYPPPAARARPRARHLAVHHRRPFRSEK